MNPKRTYVYIDSFNLYYGIRKWNQPGIKWLDVNNWLQKLLPPAQFDIQKIKFFTARVSATPKDPQKPVRQDIYFRALRTIPTLEIIEGFFLSKQIKIHVTDDVGILAKVSEEKGTDVNIAAQAVNDAHKKLYDVAVIVSNDSDLSDVVRIVTQDVGLEVGIINPCIQHSYSKQLTQNATFKKKARDKQILSSQFPASLTDAVGTFTKPQSW
jgi:uncharacterized LabA/DUF88 family protein